MVRCTDEHTDSERGMRTFAASKGDEPQTEPDACDSKRGGGPRLPLRRRQLRPLGARGAPLRGPLPSDQAAPHAGEGPRQSLVFGDVGLYAMRFDRREVISRACPCCVMSDPIM